MYQYKCLQRRGKTENIDTAAGPQHRKCPHCGGKVELLISASAIQFKGSGWYVTDYAAKKSGSDTHKDDKPATESKDASKDPAGKESGSKDSGTKDSTTKDSGSKEKKTDKSEKSGKKK